MFRVVIADDEERICKLIGALIDWSALSMELVGQANNGPDTVDLVEREKPDILITDIRMPGCTGLEVIEQVKKKYDQLEIVIISGYADFSYAQTAIKYGVGDYLLKPIDKGQLESTLRAIGEKISIRRESQSETEAIQKQNQAHAEKLKSSVILDIFTGQGNLYSKERLQLEYGMKFSADYFRFLWLKMDYTSDGLSVAGKKTVMNKSMDLLQDALDKSCQSVCLEIVDDGIVGFIHFEAGMEEEIHQALKNALQQLEVSKSLYGPIDFSIGLGAIVEDTSKLSAEITNMKKILDERLIRGTGRIYEKLPEPSSFPGQELLDYYMREMGTAIELLDAEATRRILKEIEQRIYLEKKFRGYEIKQLVHGMASYVFWKIDMDNSETELSDFDKSCDNCSKVGDLLEIIGRVQDEKMQQLIAKQEDDAVRPIRQAKQYIQNHFSEPITQEQVSQAVGLSTTYFSALFKKVEGDGFAKYLAGVRMEEAKNLLRESNISVAQICVKVGYNDVKHFTQVFEKHTGIKPSVFRKLYG